MSISRTEVVAPRTFAEGVQQIPSRNVANNVLGYGLEIYRCTTATPTLWPNPLTSITVDVEASYDAGNTWQYAGGCSGTGGIVSALKDAAVFEVPAMYLMVTLRPGTGRRIRANLTIADGSVFTGATFETFTAANDRNTIRERFRTDR